MVQAIVANQHFQQLRGVGNDLLPHSKAALLTSKVTLSLP
jgi:hypothetical protein